jgi:DUF971 family protein
LKAPDKDVRILFPALPAMSNPTSSTDPKTLDISKSQGIDIVWSDGHATKFDLAFLRDHCPCATCSNAHGTSEAQPGTISANPFVMYKARPKMVDVEMVGRYAIRIVWNDGHNTGLYSYDLLRGLCQCGECVKASSEARVPKPE